MPDPINQTTTPALPVNPPEPVLPNPQELVDAALSTTNPVSPPTTAPIPDPVPAPMPAVPPVETPVLPPPPAPTTTPTTDETPLAFMTPPPSVEGSVTAPIDAASIPPAPIAPEAKKKGKSGKVVGVVLGLLLLVMGVVGAMVGYNYYNTSKTKPSISVVNGGCGYCNSSNKCVACSVGQISMGECSHDSQCTGSVGCTSNNQCQNGEECKDGQCKPAYIQDCPAPKTQCDIHDHNSCFDLKTDHDHCGRCDKACGDGATCQAGVCVGSQNSACNPTAGLAGGCGSGLGCSCSDKVAMQNGNYSSCRCGLNGGQNDCYHTICPTNYTCQGSGQTAFCVTNQPSSPPGTTNPSPSPSPVMACTGITRTPTTEPAIGGVYTFTCAGKVTPSTAGTLSYKYRYSIDGGTTYTNMTNNKLTITACGTYSVQCQACATLAGVLKCSPTWTGATP